ncbi:MAG: nuclear transport factor 2 family protein, partial [Bacteroidota bacterium]
IHIFNNVIMSYKEKAEHLYKMIGEGQLLEAFEKYYSDDVVMTEPLGTREGKIACREYEEQFLNNIQEFHGLEVKAITSDEEAGIVIHETAMDVTFKDGNRVHMEQAGVQRWKDDKIVNERFYYSSN